MDEKKRSGSVPKLNSQELYELYVFAQVQAYLKRISQFAAKTLRERKGN